MNTNYYNKEGDISEWNEGMLKTLRIHQAHLMINQGKTIPFQKTNFYELRGYQAWARGVIILLSEGKEKYSDEEKEQVNKLKEEVEELIDGESICHVTNTNGQKLVSINTTKWNQLKPKLEEFEDSVKSYNNKHGLSTRNVGTKGLF